MSSITFREAAGTDANFLVDCILGAEKSGTDKLSYSTIFRIPETQVRELLLQILEEDIPGQELCVSGFQIAEVDAAPAAAICAWIEGQGGKSSSLIKASLLVHFFGRECLAAAAVNLELMEALALKRQAGALQLESVFVQEQFRGRGLVGQLITHHLQLARRVQPPVAEAQIILAGTNAEALAAYRRAGFEVVQQRSSDDPRLSILLPAATKVLMQRSL